MARSLPVILLSAVLILLAHGASCACYDFQGKVAFVSGASSGIGNATAMGLARCGAHVVLVARDNHPDWYTGAESEARINSDPEVAAAGGTALFMKGDVTVRDDMARIVNATVAKYGTLDIAMNIAGIGGPSGRIDQIEEYMFGPHDPIHNNLYGTMIAMQEQIKYWVKTKKEGAIVNFSSYNGLRACATCSMYSASKHGIIGITQSAALEFLRPTSTTPRIRINAVCPGLIDTPLTRNQAKTEFEGTQTWVGPLITEESALWKKYKPMCEAGLPSGQLGAPEEMAAIAMYLASPDASYISGSYYTGDFAATAV